jgi:nicotinamide mononucleotide transporter
VIGYLEILAALFGFLYIILIVQKKPVGWFFGFLSSLIYVCVCLTNQLYIQTGLQAIYALVGIFGFFRWKMIGASIKTISNKNRLIIIISGLIASFVLGYLFSKSNQVLPYLDALISVFGIIATYLTTEKRVENWIIWMVINVLSIYLFANQALYFSVVLFSAYFIVSFWGYLNWRKEIESNE